MLRLTLRSGCCAAETDAQPGEAILAQDVDGIGVEHDVLGCLALRRAALVEIADAGQPYRVQLFLDAGLFLMDRGRLDQDRAVGITQRLRVHVLQALTAPFGIEPVSLPLTISLYVLPSPASSSIVPVGRPFWCNSHSEGRPAIQRSALDQRGRLSHRIIDEWRLLAGGLSQCRNCSGSAPMFTSYIEPFGRGPVTISCISL